MRYDWRDLRNLCIQADDELTLDTLAAGAGFDADRIEKRAKAENWELMQAVYRRRLGRPQKTDILERTWAESDAQCQRLPEKVCPALAWEERHAKQS
jgi:hypothetical protein